MPCNDKVLGFISNKHAKDPNVQAMAVFFANAFSKANPVFEMTSCGINQQTDNSRKVDNSLIASAILETGIVPVLT